MTVERKNVIELVAVGDIVVDREDPESIFVYAAHVLKQADITFGQLEQSITDKHGYYQSHAWGPRRADPENIRALTAAGFNVISFASNNAMDWGPDCLLDTIANLRANSIQVVGAGANIAEARKPVIVEKKGTRVGFLSYCSIILAGYAAGPKKPGIAPMWAWTVYHQVEHDQPGTPCEILTFADRRDLELLVQDVRKLRSQVDVLAVSLHWGIHFAPGTIAMYQPEVAHAAIDAGADIILGHHPHILKGIEVYKGKVILYSMNMFGFDIPLENFPNVEALAETHKRYNYAPDPEYPMYPFHPDAKKTILVKCVIADKQIKRVSFLPAWINKENQPEILTSESEHFSQVVAYMEEITRDQGLNAKFTVEGDEVVVWA